jgi:hypothetical protein
MTESGASLSTRRASDDDHRAIHLAREISFPLGARSQRGPRSSPLNPATRQPTLTGR